MDEDDEQNAFSFLEHVNNRFPAQKISDTMWMWSPDCTNDFMESREVSIFTAIEEVYWALLLSFTKSDGDPMRLKIFPKLTRSEGLRLLIFYLSEIHNPVKVSAPTDGIDIKISYRGRGVSIHDLLQDVVIDDLMSSSLWMTGQTNANNYLREKRLFESEENPLRSVRRWMRETRTIYCRSFHPLYHGSDSHAFQAGIGDFMARQILTAGSRISVFLNKMFPDDLSSREDILDDPVIGEIKGYTPGNRTYGMGRNWLNYIGSMVFGTFSLLSCLIICIGITLYSFLKRKVPSHRPYIE